MRYSILSFLILVVFLGSAQEDPRSVILEGVKEMTHGNHEASLELLEKAKSVSQDNGDFENEFLAYNNIGANYYALLDYGEALKNYRKAHDIAVRELTAAQEMTVLNNIAILYSEDEKYKKAEAHLRNAYELAEKSNDDSRQSMYATNLGHVYIELEQYDLAWSNIQIALDKAGDDPVMKIEAKSALINYFFEVNKFTEAKEAAHTLLNEMEGVQFNDHRNSILLLLSKIAVDNGDLNDAIEFARQSLDYSTKLDSKIESYAQLSESYSKAGKYKKSIQFKDSVIVATEELSDIKNGRLFESGRIKFEMENYQRELKNSKLQIEEQERRLYIVGGTSILVIILISWALRNSYVSSRRKKALHDQQLQEQETLLQLEQERLKNEIETRNRKLTAKALHQSNRNELLGTILSDLEKLRESNDKDILNQQLNSIRRLIKNGDSWDDVMTHFEEVNQGFISNLKFQYDSLNTNDIRFLSYLYMNLSVKEIAAIFNITPETCRKRKERISKKMGLSKSSELYNHLYSLEVHQSS